MNTAIISIKYGIYENGDAGKFVLKDATGEGFLALQGHSKEHCEELVDKFFKHNAAVRTKGGKYEVC